MARNLITSDTTIRNIKPGDPRKRLNDGEGLHLLPAVLRRLEARGMTDTAHRARDTCSQVFRFAVAEGRVTSDPARDLAGALKTHQTKHIPVITEPVRFGELLRAIDGYRGIPATREGLKLAALVFLRPGAELRAAEWSEFDLDAALWTVPASRMKRRKHAKENGPPHLVPLPRQAVESLRELHRLTGHQQFVFQGVGDRGTTGPCRAGCAGALPWCLIGATPCGCARVCLQAGCLRPCAGKRRGGGFFRAAFPTHEAMPCTRTTRGRPSFRKTAGERGIDGAGRINPRGKPVQPYTNQPLRIPLLTCYLLGNAWGQSGGNLWNGSAPLQGWRRRPMLQTPHPLKGTPHVALHPDASAELLADPATRAAYDALAPEFEAARELVAARARAGLTQQQVAERMGTTQSTIARMESGKRPPSLRTVQRYAQALGCRAVVRIEMMPI